MASPITGHTSFNVNDPRTQKVWSKKFFKFMLENMLISTLIGTDGNSVVSQVTDLSAGKGGSVVFELEAPLAGVGIGDNGRLIDGLGATSNTETLNDYNFTVYIHERANGVQQAGLTSNQYTATNVKTSGLRRLGVWAAEAVEDDIIRALSGVDNTDTTIATVNQKNPTQNRYFAIGQLSTTPWTVQYAQIDGTNTIAGAVTDNLPLAGFTADATAVTYRFGTRVIEFLKRKAQEVITGTYGASGVKIPKLAPVRDGGSDVYVCIISRLMMKSLRADTNWNESQQSANVRGNTNPLFSGAAGIWDGVIIKVSERLQQRVGAGGVTSTEYFNIFETGAGEDAAASGVTVDRGLFCGSQAGVLAWGKMPTKSSSREDIDRLDAVAVSMIYGASKTQFSNAVPNWTTDVVANTATEDYGVICFDTVVDSD